MNFENIARLTHTVNKIWCEYNGDFSQKDWEDAPDWQRESAISGVIFHLNNPDADDSASHNEWMKFKLEEGWTYGPVKYADKKEHPCMVPFDQLPPEQQFKDKLFRTIVHSY
jgi:RyR domain